MKGIHPARALAALGMLLALVVPPVAGQGAQGTPDPSEPVQPIPDFEVISEREVFSYPRFPRRNPFRPLLRNEAGPRFEQVELRGVILDRSDPSRSVALLGLRRFAEQERQQGIQQQILEQETGITPQRDTIVIPDPTMRLRAGQRWGGSLQVVRIEGDHVVMNVTEFGITEQRILRMTVRRQGGPR